MKIKVLSTQGLKNQYYIDESWFDDEYKYFISIAGMNDGCEYPCPFLTSDSKRVLHLLFDDITAEEKNNQLVILFDNERAKKIIEFAQTIPANATVYINCNSGISRSGAIGECLNTYFNEHNKEDYEEFLKINSHIQPNEYIKNILTKELKIRK